MDNSSGGPVTFLWQVISKIVPGQFLICVKGAKFGSSDIYTDQITFGLKNIYDLKKWPFVRVGEWYVMLIQMSHLK